MLREEIKAGTALGNAAKSIMASGGLVGDDLVNRMLAQRVSAPDSSHGFLLDGYPRTVEQAEYLDRLLGERQFESPIVLHLDVPDGRAGGPTDFTPPMPAVQTDLQSAAAAAANAGRLRRRWHAADHSQGR